MLRAVTACRCSMGSSVILKMNAERALKDLDIGTRLEASDVITGKSVAHTTSLVLIERELAYLVQDVDKPIIQLTSLVNEQEMKDKLREYYEANGIKQRL